MRESARIMRSTCNSHAFNKSFRNLIQQYYNPFLHIIILIGFCKFRSNFSPTSVYANFVQIFCINKVMHLAQKTWNVRVNGKTLYPLRFPRFGEKLRGKEGGHCPPSIQMGGARVPDKYSLFIRMLIWAPFSGRPFCVSLVPHSLYVALFCCKKKKSSFLWGWFNRLFSSRNYLMRLHSLPQYNSLTLHASL